MPTTKTKPIHEFRSFTHFINTAPCSEPVYVAIHTYESRKTPYFPANLHAILCLAQETRDLIYRWRIALYHSDDPSSVQDDLRPSPRQYCVTITNHVLAQLHRNKITTIDADMIGITDISPVVHDLPHLGRTDFLRASATGSTNFLELVNSPDEDTEDSQMDEDEIN